MRNYFRPIPTSGARGRSLSGGALRFDWIEVLSREGPPQVVPADAVATLYPEAEEILARLEAPRPAICGIGMAGPRVMGVVNVTPDSFSDGGRLRSAEMAIGHGLSLVDAGADLLDIGGESTRPGAEPVPAAEELARVLPVIDGLIAAGCPVPISIDTRKAEVARQALAAGARLFNDVSALTHDPESGHVAQEAPALCLMHAQGDPRTMQNDPRYEDVLLDVYDFLEARLAAADISGLDPARIVLDPGIGFGKTEAHNLALIRRLSLFHALGCPILLGVSRKGFIGRISGENRAEHRAPGSIAAGLAGLDQGVQILRVHDVAETVQAVRVWQAIREEA
ncbi:MAG: dihydropteroate synthase [Pseudomonadota bacterium]